MVEIMKENEGRIKNKRCDWDIMSYLLVPCWKLELGGSFGLWCENFIYAEPSIPNLLQHKVFLNSSVRVKKVSVG